MPQCSTAISISSSPSGPGLISSSTIGSFADRATQVWWVIAFAPADGRVCVNVDMENSFRGSMLAVVEKLLAGDLVVLHRVDGDFFAGDALASGFGGDVEGEVNNELVGVCAVEERAGHGFAIEGLVGDPVFGFLDHRTLAFGFLAVAFDRNDVGRVHGAHHVEVFALAAQLYKLTGNSSETHNGLLLGLGSLDVVTFWPLFPIR